MATVPPVAPTRPLWWLARWAARLLTGFAVAAAFTVGAWALPAHASLADSSAAASPAPLACDVTTPHELIASATPGMRCVDGDTELVETAATPPVALGHPELAVRGGVPAEVAPVPSVVVADRPAARAPPRA